MNIQPDNTFSAIEQNSPELQAPAPKGRRKSRSATAPNSSSSSAATIGKTERTGKLHDALIQEQHRREAAERALEEEKNKLAAVQATLHILETQQQSSDKRTMVSDVAAEIAGAMDNIFALNPFAGVNRHEILAASRQLVQQVFNQPGLAVKQYAIFLYEMQRILRRKSTLAPNPGDKRFADLTWKENWFYHAYLQSYLAWRQGLYAFVDGASLSPRETARARFTLSLLTETLAPSNSLLGNPAALKRLLETGGASGVRGVQNMIRELVFQGGLPAQVDRKAFQVGKNLGVLPGAVVFKNEVLELIQYMPSTEQVYGRPLLCIPPQVNKFYIMDLAPGRSLLEYVVKQGIQTFVVSWRNPTYAERDWGLETYMQAILDALDAVREITGSHDVNMLAACSGGMTLTPLLAHLAARNDSRINAATLMVTVLDFSIESQLGMFVSEETIALAKMASQRKGVLEGQAMARVFAWMRPNDLIWAYWVNNYLLGNAPPAFDILFWNNDSTRLPAKLHGEMLDMALVNPFKNSGSLTLLGTPIDLSMIKNDLYLVGGTTDHITPWQGCYATTQLVGGMTEFILSNSGHIQSILNPLGNPKASFFTNSHYPADPEQWVKGATKQNGSWWEHWQRWLVMRSGELKVAPQMLGSRRFTPGVAAPGSYVFEP